ncbi:MAG: phage tail tape measure protein [Oscillospiraceae bacterium]|nr:phage tail tape measure protein [Oscillospiraceae bacterium]
MAREYEMLFKLGAQLGQNFSGTFSSAQKVLAATQKEIQALNKLQSDVNSYEKQQASIEKSNEKLELYKKQLENIQNEMARSGTASAELANKELELQQRIRNTEEQIAAKTQRLSQMGNALNEAGVDISALSNESRKLQDQMAELRAQEEAAAHEAAKFGDKSVSAFEAAGAALVSAGIAKALNEIYDAYKECVNISMEFGSTMSTVEALSGANVEEMKKLTAQAKELGASTVYTAQQSASAMTYMGMAGWDAGEMLSGMNGVLALASASGEDLAMVSDIVTDDLTAFKLTAKDTAHFVDVLASAASNSNTSVSIMGETFKKSASVAGTLRYSIEDVAVAVGLMANSGVKGSMAGTALKNTFDGLLKGATLTSAAFGEVEFTSKNVDGTMKDFSETIDELRGYFEQMTDAERMSNAQAIAGEYGYNGLLAILNSTDEQYQSLTKSINECTGAAQRMAEIKLDNLKGDVTLLESAADGLKMSIGELYNDELRGLAQFETEILTGINEFVQENPAVVKAIMAIAAEIGAVLLVYNAVNTAKKVKNALDTMSAVLEAKKAAAAGAAAAATTAEATATTGATAAQTGLNTAMLASPIFIFTVAVAALTAGIIGLREANKMESLEMQTLSTATQEQYNRVSELNDEYNRAVEAYGATSDKARTLKYDLDEANASIEANAFSVKELYFELDALHTSTSDLLGAFYDSSNEIDNQRERAAILIAKLKELGSTSEKTAGTQSQMEAIIEKLNKDFPSLGLNIENVTENLDEMMKKIDEASGANSIQAKYETAKEQLSDLYAQEVKLKEAYDKAIKASIIAGSTYSNAVGDNIFSAAYAMIAGTESQTKADLDKANQMEAQALEDWQAIQAAIAEAEASLAEYGEVVSGTSEKAVSVYDGMSIAISKVTDRTEELLAAYNEAYEAAYDSINGQYALWDTAARVIPTSIGTINTALDTQYEYWNDYNTSLENLLSRAENIDGLKDVLATFADGSEESVNAIAGMAKASDKELKQMVEFYQKLKEQQDLTSQSLADVRVDFDSEMDEITAKMEETIENMNMEAEAAEAAKATITAYADAILEYKGTVTDAANAVAASVAASLSFASTISVGNSPGSTSSTLLSPSELESAMNFVGPKLYGYASGTSNAARGWDLVGENGPELRFFNGGETVIPTDRTQAILQDYNRLIDYAETANGANAQSSTAIAAIPITPSSQPSINISPSFVINGGNNDDIEEKLNKCVEQIKEAVMEAMADNEVNARRSAYA